MLDRNKRIKSKPERFQNCKDKFDLVITCEERVYDQVLEGEISYKKYLSTKGRDIDSYSVLPWVNTSLIKSYFIFISFPQGLDYAHNV